MKGSPTNLYRHRDSAGNLLYVGISLSAVERLKQHMVASGWSSEIATVEIARYPTRMDALNAERDAIQKEDPLWNRQHSRRRACRQDPDGESMARWVDRLVGKIEHYRTAAVEICRTSDNAKYGRVYGYLNSPTEYDGQEIVAMLPNGNGVRMWRPFPSTRVSGPNAFSFETRSPDRLEQDIRWILRAKAVPASVAVALLQFEAQWRSIPVINLSKQGQPA